MAKKKVVQRVADHRAKKKAQGYRQVCVLLPARAIGKLDKLAGKNGQTRAQVIEQLLK